MQVKSTQEQSSIDWLPVVGYEHAYEVSSLGQVRSVDRIVTGQDGVQYPFKGRILIPSAHKDTGYLQVSLWDKNTGTSHYVHRLVCMAFHPNPEGKPEVNHIDGVRQNNWATNLEWVTSSENSYHATKTGLRIYTNRLTKAEFIECLLAVIDGLSYQELTLHTPYKVPFLSTKLRKLAKELGLENQLNESLYLQRVQRARMNGAKNTGCSHQ